MGISFIPTYLPSTVLGTQTQMSCIVPDLKRYTELMEKTVPKKEQSSNKHMPRVLHSNKREQHKGIKGSFWEEGRHT